MEKKVCILACGGLNNVLGTVVRQVAYVLNEDLRPDDTVLGCMPALHAGVQEDIDFITQYPILTIEACEYSCAKRLVQKYSQKNMVTVMAEDFLKEKNIVLEKDTPERLSAEGKRAVELLAEFCASKVDELL